MPLINIHLVRGRSTDQIRSLLDAVHDAMVQAFKVPNSDRYQLVTQHERDEVVALDTGLNIPRSDGLVIVKVISRPRPQEAKAEFYARLADNLSARCGIASTDLIVTIVENSAADWSFGHGRAQFLTGDL